MTLNCAIIIFRYNYNFENVVPVLIGIGIFFKIIF